MPDLTIRLDGVPRGKERVRFSRATGTAFTPARTVAYEGRLALAAQHAMAGRALLDGPLIVDVLVEMPIPQSWARRRREDAAAGRSYPTKKPDWDNFAKIMDALNAVVWVDDAQIIDGRVRKVFSERPGLTIDITEQREGIFG